MSILDLDVPHPDELPHAPPPIEGALSKVQLLNLLRHIQHSRTFIGPGLYEHALFGGKSSFIPSVFHFLL